MASLILRFLEPEGEARTLLEAYARRTLKNWNGIPVGEVRAVAPLTDVR
jgi:L-asparaginase II